MSACLRGIPVGLGAAGRAVELLRARTRPDPADPSASGVRSVTTSTATSGTRRARVFVMRHCVPMRLPLRSPASRLAITSASDTPSAFAASAGPSVSGMPDARGAARRPPASPAP